MEEMNIFILLYIILFFVFSPMLFGEADIIVNLYLRLVKKFKAWKAPKEESESWKKLQQERLAMKALESDKQYKAWKSRSESRRTLSMESKDGSIYKD
jgi:hypothetical protein